MRKFLSLTVLSLMVSLTVLGAQNQATIHLRGKVLDSLNLPMQAVAVKVYRGSTAPREGTAPVKEGVTDGNGDFDIEVPAGDYYIDVTAPDFNPFRQAVKVAAEMQPLAVTLTVKTVETVIDVTSQTSELGVDPDSSLTTDTITGDALLDLPDNEEDLLNYLLELAAQRGIVDGEVPIRVDGFENSALPNRAEIQEIRIVNTSFSADTNASGPRIEILTRPGTGNWTGNLGFRFGDDSLNANAPLSDRDKPNFQTRNFDGQLRGPIIPGRVTASISVGKVESDSEGNPVRAVGINGPIDGGVTNMTRGKSFAFRPNVTISRSHTLNANFSYSDSRTENAGVGGFNLPERASNRESDNWQLQLSERATFSNRLTNEFRVQIRQSNSDNVPVTDAMAINVQDSFNSGGNPNRSESESRDYLVGTTVRWQAARTLTLTMAAEMNYHKTYNNSQNNYLGTYTFSSLADYCYAEGFPGTECPQYKAIVDQAAIDGVTPTLPGTPIPITGVPTRFTITQGNPELSVQQAEYSGYIQGEWRMNPRAQLSFGARYQAQQHLSDYNNIAPTVGLSYQLSTRQNWQTVVRVGGRMNYQTFSMGSWEQLLRNSGSGQYQTSYQVENPAYPLPDFSLLNQVAQQVTTIRVRAEDFVAGYNIQPTFSVDQSLPKGHRLSFNFQISRGVHQSRNRNINAPYPGDSLPADVLALYLSRDPVERQQGRDIVNSMRPDPTVGNINQQESVGKSLAKNFSIQYRLPNKRVMWNKFQVGGNISWNMTWSEDDNGTPMNNYDLASNWGRSGQLHRVSASVNVQAPWALTFRFNSLGWSSGRYYNIISGVDQNGDGSNNDRPAGFAKNAGTAPSTFNVINVSISKDIGLGGGNPRPPSNYVEPQRGGGGFGGGGGGFGGGGRGNAGARRLTLSVQVNNLFNSTVLQGINGNASSPLFGQPTGGGQGRRITLNLQTNLGNLF